MALVIAAHGTRSAEGRRTTERVAEEASRISGHEIRVGWIDILEPTLAEVLDGLDTPVVVPWLVGGGYHLLVDVHRVAERVNPSAVVTGPLGESSALVDALVDRLERIGSNGTGQGPVALAWAGSSVEAARKRVALIAARLMVATGRPVVPVPMSACEVAPEHAVAEVGREFGASPVVLSLLLAPGFFHDRASRLGPAATAPVGAHPAVVAWVAAAADLARASSKG